MFKKKMVSGGIEPPILAFHKKLNLLARCLNQLGQETLIFEAFYLVSLTSSRKVRLRTKFLYQSRPGVSLAIKLSAAGCKLLREFSAIPCVKPDNCILIYDSAVPSTRKQLSS